jgi:hypothetical protein
VLVAADIPEAIWATVEIIGPRQVFVRRIASSEMQRVERWGRPASLVPPQGSPSGSRLESVRLIQSPKHDSRPLRGSCCFPQPEPTSALSGYECVQRGLRPRAPSSGCRCPPAATLRSPPHTAR